MLKPAVTPHDTTGTLASSGLLETKLYPRPAHAKLVTRPRICTLLDEGLSASLVLVSAPAGFGKTTVLADWLSLHPCKFSWLSLDAADNDPTRFWTYVILSLQALHDELGESTLAQLRSAHPPPTDVVVTSLVNEIISLPGPLVLVLDDYHAITSNAVHESLAFLIENLPSNLHLILSTRFDPPLPVAKLRSRGQVVEIRTDHLRFIPDEASAFLSQTMGLALSSEQVIALDERTEGWIAALQMAALSMRGRQDQDSFIRAFTGTHRFIMDFMLEEVLAREPEEVQNFLLRTSILSRLAGPLCDAVTGSSDGQDRLERLEKRNLFVVPLDDERHWYRYHHLFADLLQAQLQRSCDAEGVAALHIRAAEWYAQNGSVEEAINHASLASDDERVERFIEQHYREILSRGEQAAMRYWSGSLSRDLVCRRPWLCIYEAHSRAWFGELDEADRLLDEAEKRIPTEASNSESRAMRGHSAYVKSRVTAMRGDLPRAIDFCRTACDNVPASNLYLHFNTRVTLGYEYFLNGDYAEARQILGDAIRSGVAAGALIYTVAAACMMARLVAVQGRLHESRDIYQKMAQLITQTGGRHRDATALVEIGLSEVLCEWNDLEAAQAHLQQGLALLPFWGKADDLALAYLIGMRIHLGQANLVDARADINSAIQIIQKDAVFPEVRHAAEIAQVRLWLAEGDLQAANHWYASQEQRLGSDERFDFRNELAHIARARVLIAQNKPKRAISLLSKLDKAAQSAGRMGRVLEILILEALAMQKAGDSEHALPGLTKCLTMAETEGYARIFLEEGESMQSLLAQWLARAEAGSLRDYASHLLSQFGSRLDSVAKPQKQVTPTVSLIEPLSQRELEVLQLMALGRTNQEIGRQLIVSPGTVKAHTASIYRKLDVSNRTEAVARARQLGILP